MKDGEIPMKIPEPFFIKNEEWFVFNEEECRYDLTDKAPKDAVESYNEFYEKLAKSFVPFNE